jgi:hypothetical protein
MEEEETHEPVMVEESITSSQREKVDASWWLPWINWLSNYWC